MKFDINYYGCNYCMHCKTETEAKSFCNYLHGIGKKWGRYGSYAENTYFEVYGSDTVYMFNQDLFDNITSAKRRGDIILEWSDFKNAHFSKADLQTGDVCKQRNGLVEIYIKDMDMFITADHWNDAEKFNEDLTHPNGNDFDIVAVRRPLDKMDCNFEAFDGLFGELVYERKEPEEMTLEEICRLLGKEIKIVKSKKVQ